MYRSANVCAKATASFLSRAAIGVLLVLLGVHPPAELTNLITEAAAQLRGAGG